MGKFEAEPIPVPEEEGLRQQLKSITIKNYRAIGPTGVYIKVDDIIVLVGPNNSGKSSILRAYEIIMDGSAEKATLSIDDFHNEDASNIPEIVLETYVNEKNKPGEKWIIKTDGPWYVRERWTWPNPGQGGVRVGWNAQLGKWADDEKEKHPWGANNVANSKRPEPCRIEAFAKPETHTEQILKVIRQVLSQRMKEIPSYDNPEKTAWEELIERIKLFQEAIVSAADNEIGALVDVLGGFVSDIFPSYKINFQAPEKSDLEKAITLFKAGGQLKMGPDGGLMTTPERQGSGALRALLWAALKLDTERKRKQVTDRPYVLLIDEPELCLHPDTVREACRVLYDLPIKSTW